MRLRSTDVNEQPWLDPFSGAQKGVSVVEVAADTDGHYQVYVSDPDAPGSRYTDALTACGMLAGEQVGALVEICERCRVCLSDAFDLAEGVLRARGQLQDDVLREQP